MTEIIKKLELKREEIAIGALLHDIGKFIMRKDGKKNGTHQLYGYKYLKEITNEEIAQYALKHHESEKEELNAVKAGLDKWIVCYADNLSSGERNPYTNEYDKKVWDPEVSIKNIFSIILNSKDFYDNPMEKLPENPVNEKIPYPQINFKTSKGKYEKLFNEFIVDFEQIKKIDSDRILVLLEKYLSNVPSYTANPSIENQPDISLFDHLKTTAAISLVMLNYIIDTGEIPQSYTGMKKIFKQNDAFSLIEFDISGIQKFIYTIKSNKALKNLKARSFYLELMTEHICQDLVNELNLCRANILYQGGGGALLLVPNTPQSNKTVDNYFMNFNKWLFKVFEEKLYIAWNTPEEIKFNSSLFVSKTDPNEKKVELAKIFKQSKDKIAEKKSQKYKFMLKEIFEIRPKAVNECSTCNFPIYENTENSIDTDSCPHCIAFENFGKEFAKNDKFFLIKTESSQENSLEIDGKYYSLKPNPVQKDTEKIYAVNTLNFDYYKFENTSNLFVGQFLKGQNNTRELNDYAEESLGVNKIGILRMDVDNLGTIFKKGLDSKNYTISRFSALSRNLNNFFKYYIYSVINNENQILNNPIIKRDFKNVMIVYSGGDDLYMIGAWSDVIDSAFKINSAFKKYVANNPKITLSAGFVITDRSFPVHISAELSEKEEKNAKNNFEKNSISFWDTAIKWEEFENEFKSMFDNLIELGINYKNEEEKGNKLEMEFEHSTFYSIMDEIRKRIEIEEKDKNKNFYYIFPNLSYKLARHLQRSEKIKKDDNKQKAFEKFSNTLCSIDLLNNDIEEIKNNFKRRKNYMGLIELMQRTKSKEQGGSNE